MSDYLIEVFVFALLMLWRFGNMGDPLSLTPLNKGISIEVIFLFSIAVPGMSYPPP